MGNTTESTAKQTSTQNSDLKDSGVTIEQRLNDFVQHNSIHKSGVEGYLFSLQLVADAYSYRTKTDLTIDDVLIYADGISETEVIVDGNITEGH